MTGGWARRLIVFVKEPRSGKAKTRLAAGIGTARAASFYRQSTDKLLSRLGGDRRWETSLAVTPTSAVSGGWPGLWPENLPRIAQGEGDLGARMGRLFRRMPSGPVVIIGSDAPQINVAHIVSAFDMLGGKDAVFGPAEDGGYWLIGLKRRRSLPDFDGVRWSTEHTLADTLAGLPGGYESGFLETLRDVDEAEDLAAAPNILLRSLARI